MDISSINKYNLLGVKVNATDYETAVSKIIDAAKDKKEFGVSALAVHGVMTGVLDIEHRYRLNKLHLVLPDGQPVRWALNMLYRCKLKDRVYGPTLTLLICKRVSKEGLPLFFFGSNQTVLDKMIENITKRYPSVQIAGCAPSIFRQLSLAEQDDLNDLIKKSGAAITFVGLGCPRQEVFVYENMSQLSMPLIAVGAAFDFHAGTLSQAPSILQKFGLEWFFRLIQEPGRLLKRYVMLNPLFMLLVGLQALKLKEIPSDNLPSPKAPIRFG